MKQENKILTKLIFFILIIFSPSLIISQNSNDFNKISTDSLMKHVQVLCSDEASGRLPDTKGYDFVTQYCVNYFKQIGVKSLNNKKLNGYFQTFQLETNEIKLCNLSIINGANIKYDLKAGKDFSCRGFTGSGKGIVDVVFCGYGETHDGYNDYRGMDLKGKAVMIFKANPSFPSPDTSWGEFSIRRKVETAKKQGAVAVIFVSRANLANPQKSIGSTSHGEGIQNVDIPQFQVNVAWADTILEGTRYPLTRLDKLIENLKMPFSLFTKSKIEYEVVANYNPNATSHNIIGFVEGSNPVLKSEYIIISAHLDHVGMQGEVIYRGANDNASGSAAVLEIARIVASNPIKPARSILFVLFTAEEKGLVGSTFMASNLPIPKDKIVGMLNMDCIAFGDSIQVGNGEANPDWWKKVKEIDENSSKLMVEKTWNGGGADLSPFHNIGISGLYFVSKNSYTHLHLPSDTPETLNKKTFTDIVKLVYNSAMEKANTK